jgi:AcrR family transcriptional regulator
VGHLSAEERRPQLVAAAITVMTRDGIAAATTRAVAAEAGTAQAMVHYVFGTKDELYRAAIEKLTADVSDQVREGGAVTQGESFRAAVSVFAADLWTTVTESPAIHQLLTELMFLGLRSDSLRPMIQQYQEQLDAAFCDYFTRTATRTHTSPARPIAEISHFFAAGVDGLIVQRLARQSDGADERCLHDLVEATVALAEGRSAQSSAPANILR